MDLFVLDTEGNKDLLQQFESHATQKASVLDGKKNINNLFNEHEGSDDEDYDGLPPPSKDISHIIQATLKTTGPKKKEKKDEVDAFVEYMGWNEKNDNKVKKGKSGYKFPELNLLTGKIEDDLSETNVKEQLDKSDLKAIEKVKQIPKVSERKLKDLRRIERSKTKGSNWFNMPATEVTEEVQNDLKLLQMRSVLDPKHFYKKNDLKVLPKYFQIGTVQHSPLDHYNERDTRKNKKRTIVDELLADAEFQSFTKRKYKEILKKNEKTGYHKAVKKMKKIKKKK